MTLLSSLSERLMFFVSSIRVLVFGLSEPAKSTKFTEPTHVSPFSWCVPSSMIFVTACDRDDRSLPAVAAVARFILAMLISWWSRAGDSTVSSIMFDTYTSVLFLALAILISSSFVVPVVSSRSYRTSL
uniref:Uncharacterized protein n=1 Tax=Anopheles darlingi TaxID=43151 RepID=A0A2M4DBL8_ANODA